MMVKLLMKKDMKRPDRMMVKQEIQSHVINVLYTVLKFDAN